MRRASRTKRSRRSGFALSSFVATLLFGVAVGNVIQGVPITAAGEYDGSLVAQLNPYALLVGALTVTLFAMHGTIFLYLKTEGELQPRAQRWIWRNFGLFLVVFMLTTMYTLVAVPEAVAQRAQPAYRVFDFVRAFGQQPTVDVQRAARCEHAADLVQRETGGAAQRNQRQSFQHALAEYAAQKG